jgi:hypothetical protein
MLTWQTVDPKAVYPTSRYVAVSGDREPPGRLRGGEPP